MKALVLAALLALPLQAWAQGAWHGGERPALKAKDIDGQAEELLLYAEQHRRARRFDDAFEAANDALKLLEKRYGMEDRRLVKPLNALGGIFFNQAKHAQAEAYYKRAAAIEEKWGGGDPIAQAKALQAQAKLLLNSGRAAEAVPLERRALKLYEKAYAGTPDALQGFYIIAANTEKYAGNYDEALRLLDKAEAIAAKYGSAAKASVDISRSHVRFQQKRYEEAIALLRGVIAAYEQKYGREHWALRVPYNEMANSLAALGRKAEADAARERVKQLPAR